MTNLISAAPPLTRWPFVFSCNGRHILHTSQWKKLLRPPIRQMPQPLQWYWSLSSSSNKLHIKQVYCKDKECIFYILVETVHCLLLATIYLPFQIVHHNFHIRLAPSALYHILYIWVLSVFFYRSDDPRFRRDSIDICRIFRSTASEKKNHQKQTNRNHHHCYATESSNRNLYYHYFYVSLFIELNALLWRIQVTGNLRQYSLFHSERDSGIFIVNGARRHTRSA